MNYYEILGLHKSATDQEIKSAYRRLIKVHHPDLNDGSVAAVRKSRSIIEAYKILSDPATRKKYDFDYVQEFNGRSPSERKSDHTSPGRHSTPNTSKQKKPDVIWPPNFGRSNRRKRNFFFGLILILLVVFIFSRRNYKEQLRLATFERKISGPVFPQYGIRNTYLNVQWHADSLNLEFCLRSRFEDYNETNPSVLLQESDSRRLFTSSLKKLGVIKLTLMDKSGDSLVFVPSYNIKEGAVKSDNEGYWHEVIFRSNVTMNEQQFNKLGYWTVKF